LRLCNHFLSLGHKWSLSYPIVIYAWSKRTGTPVPCFSLPPYNIISTPLCQPFH
jgi:hypothetical protein